MNALFLVSVCGINRKKFSSVPVKVVDINLHFHEQLLMSQDKSIYNLRVEGSEPETKSYIVFLST